MTLQSNAALGTPKRGRPSKKYDLSTPPRSSQKRPWASGESVELRTAPQKSHRILGKLHSTVTSPHPTSATNIGKAETQHSRLMRVARALRPSAPKLGLLPCRAAERRNIARHLRSGVEQGGSGQILYVSGMPGTGKTAICLEVLQLLRKKIKFDLAHVNAMRLGAPNQVFKDIADELLPERTSNCGARSALARYFSGRRAEDSVVVLLIDEVDCLVTSNQAVLYGIFDWLGLPNARLILVAISNTMDLPERLLPRVASRFHIERVDFSPYNKAQVYEILRCRLQSQDAVDCFGDVVLKLCAARVAGASGDIRKALQICRRAIEAHLGASQAGTITLADLQMAEKDLVLANPTVKAIMGLSCQTRRFLAAVVIELRRSGAQTIPVRQAAQCFQKLLGMVAMDNERGCNASTLNSDFANMDEIDESAEQFVQRLEPMSILKQTKFGTSADALPGMVVSLGSLNEDEIAKALLQVEDDSTIRELLQGDEVDVDMRRHQPYVETEIGQPDSEANLVPRCQEDSTICKLPGMEDDALCIDVAVNGESGWTGAEGLGDQQVHAQTKHDVHDDGNDRPSAKVAGDHHEKREITDLLDTVRKMLVDSQEMMSNQPCAEIGFSQCDEEEEVLVERGADETWGSASCTSAMCRGGQMIID